MLSLDQGIANQAKTTHGVQELLSGQFFPHAAIDISVIDLYEVSQSIEGRAIDNDVFGVGRKMKCVKYAAKWKAVRALVLPSSLCSKERTECETTTRAEFRNVLSHLGPRKKRPDKVNLPAR